MERRVGKKIKNQPGEQTQESLHPSILSSQLSCRVSVHEVTFLSQHFSQKGGPRALKPFSQFSLILI